MVSTSTALSERVRTVLVVGCLVDVHDVLTREGSDTSIHVEGSPSARMIAFASVVTERQCLRSSAIRIRELTTDASVIR